jgi:hypothetical protein
MNTRNIIKGIIEEGRRVTIYHGDNYGLKKLDNYALMALPDSNQQEGPGIYFATDPDTTKAYGDKVVSTTIDPKKFLPSRDLVEDHLSTKTLSKMFRDIFKDDEDFWYLLTDYGVYVTELEEVEDYHWDELADNMRNEEIRNFLITLVESADTKSVVKNFVKHSGYYGTYNDQVNTKNNDTWYALLYNDDKLTKVDMEKL